jgi:hypothetical protein
MIPCAELGGSSLGSHPTASPPNCPRQHPGGISPSWPAIRRLSPGLRNGIGRAQTAKGRASDRRGPAMKPAAKRKSQPHLPAHSTSAGCGISKPCCIPSRFPLFRKKRERLALSVAEGMGHPSVVSLHAS